MNLGLSLRAQVRTGPSQSSHSKVRAISTDVFPPIIDFNTSRVHSLLSLYVGAPDDGQWGADVFEAHAIGVNAVSWAPAVVPGSLLAPTPAAAPSSAHPATTTTANATPATTTTATTTTGSAAAGAGAVKRFASAGCDNLVKIWGWREETQSWVEEEVLEGHVDWVRDVAWAPNVGVARSYVATASQVRFGGLLFILKGLLSEFSSLNSVNFWI